MALNWVDWFVLIILIGTTICGFIKGLARQIIFIAAIIAGFIIAARHYLSLASSLRPALANENWSRLIAFLLIFFSFLLLGWILAIIISKLMKGPLKAANVILGGLFGFIKGALIASVFVMALLLFPIREKDLIQSQLAFPCLNLGRALIQLVPEELKVQFREAYKHLKGEQSPSGRKV